MGAAPSRGLPVWGSNKNEKDRKSTRLNSSHTEIYTLSLHDALPIFALHLLADDLRRHVLVAHGRRAIARLAGLGIEQKRERSEEHTSELQSHRDLHSFPTRRSSDLRAPSPRR